MTQFQYRDGILCSEEVPLDRIAEAVGTPVYVYSAAEFRRNYRAYRDALASLGVEICYALKANSNLGVVALLAAEGAGADVVSAGELERALAAGIPASRVVFSGVGKSRDEIALALERGIHQLNAESMPELQAISDVASSMGRTAPVAIRINPDVDAKTHAKITTGRKENKFGIDIEHAPDAFERGRSLPGIAALGVAVHIGSQLLDLAPYRAAYTRVAELVRALRQRGHGIERIDLGGGLGIPYRPQELRPDLDKYAQVVRETVGDLGCALTIEPGRSIAGSAGVLLARVAYVKQGLAKRFLILDAAMNDLLRPALYEAWHRVRPVAEPAVDAVTAPVDIVGPVCETGDTFALGRELPPIAAGELVVFDDAGAYGAVMASTYNSRPLVPEVLVDGERFAVVRKRPTFEDMLSFESVPGWLGSGARRDEAKSKGGRSKARG